MPESTPSPDKQELRKLLRARRGAITPEQRARAAGQAARLASQLPHWPAAHTVAFYMASAEEFECGPLLEMAWQADKDIYLPVMNRGDALDFHRHAPGEPLHEQRYGILEPPASAKRISISALDIMFMPLVGWNHRGTRLGMGAGFYDRALTQERPGALIGLGFDCQECDALPSDGWDVPLDWIVTESRIVRAH